MKKSEAIQRFNTAAQLARALGRVRQDIQQWPEELKYRQENEILGAMMRMRMEIPAEYDAVVFYRAGK